MKKYPKDYKVSPWTLCRDKDRHGVILSIKRQIKKPDGTRTWERYPKQKYAAIADNHEELEKLVIRLNGRDLAAERAKARWEIASAFIDSQTLKEFHQSLLVQMDNELEANKYYNYFRKYFIDFFSKFSDDPLEWHKMQDKWTQALLNKNDCPDELRIFPKKRLMSVNVLKRIVTVSNKFMKFLHKKRPDTVKELVFEPLTRAHKKKIAAERKLAGQVAERHYIPDSDWRKIRNKLPKDIKSCTLLAYLYGLRAAETLGLYEQNKSVKKGYLHITRQLEKYSNEEAKFTPLKGREERKVPHWYSDPAKTYAIIDEIHPMHPHTLEKKLTKVMRELGMKYTFHDFRHTWITNSARNYNIRDVQMAAGHKDLSTTNAYLKDDRDLDDETWVPTAG